MTVEECCATCKRCYTLEKWDYTDIRYNGVPKTKMEGLACTALSDDGIVIWQVGGGDIGSICECYEPKGDDHGA